MDGSNDLGRDRYLELVAASRAAFPDMEVEILLQIAEGDKVATRWRIRGTNLGPFYGEDATGRRADWTGIEIDVVREGKIVESWVDWDQYRLMQQVGRIA